MKILHVTRRIGPGIAFGGLERAVGELVDSQKGLGLTTTVLRVDNAQLRTTTRSTEPTVDDQARGQRCAANDRDISVLHAHDWYAAPIAEQYFRNGLRAIVATAHLPTRRGFTYLDSDWSWEATARFEARLFEIAAKVIAASPYVAQFLSSEYGIPDSRIATIPLGVNGERFPLRANGHADPANPRLLFVGRVTEQKGLELLIRAMPTVLSAIPGARLTVVGSGDRVAACQRLANRLEVSREVLFKPFVNIDRLAEAYASSDLLIIPSLFEPFGLVGLEAMACGCPVLGIEPTGAIYLNAQERTPHHSPSRLAAAISARISQTRLGLQDRQSLRDRALAWSWSNTAKQTLALYKEVMQ